MGPHPHVDDLTINIGFLARDVSGNDIAAVSAAAQDTAHKH